VLTEVLLKGYPDGHPDNPDVDANYDHLKEKCDAGADFILTQLSYDANTILDFARKCRAKGNVGLEHLYTHAARLSVLTRCAFSDPDLNLTGITAPIVAGLMPIYTYERLVRVVRMSQVSVPPDLFAKIANIKVRTSLAEAICA
jgi:methylenetetrahydrofolate reductase (NADPH)